MDGTMSDRPAIKKASPHDVKKAFGVHAERVLAVIDSHADSIEGLITQVEFLTRRQQVEAGTFWLRLRWLLRGH
jgi:hypothetical protein